MNQSVPNVKSTTPVEHQDLRVGDLSRRVTATRQISLNGGIVTLDDTQARIQPAPIRMTSQLLKSTFVITVVGRLRCSEPVVSILVPMCASGIL